MPDPILFVVDHDPETLKCVAEALERRFGADYQIVTESSATGALSRLEQACERGEQIPLVIADLWMEEMSGLDWLARVREACPKAARCALISYGDPEGFGLVRRALTTGQVESFLIKPCDDPEERLYPVVTEILARWSRANRPRVPLLKIVGERWSQHCHEMRDLLQRSGLSFSFHSHDSDEGRRLLEEVGHTGRLPAVIFGGRVLADPSPSEVAEALGARV